MKKLFYFKMIVQIVCILISAKSLAQGKEIEVFKAKEIRAVQPAAREQANKSAVAVNKKTREDLDVFYGTYYYWVPGTSYTIPDYSNNQIVIHNSAGTGVLNGGIKINSDGTYIWNSSWDQKIIRGKWQLTNDKDYPIILLQAQEGKNWKVGLHNRSHEADIYIWDGNTWYSAKKVKQ